MHDGHPPEDESDDILDLVDRLEDLVSASRRVPFSGRIMVVENQFLAIVDQLRETVPAEIQGAQRVINERERIVFEAQENATKILKTARDRAEYLLSDKGLLNEARQQGEEMLRQAEERRKRDMGNLEMAALEQFTIIEEAMRDGLDLIEGSMREILARMERGKQETVSLGGAAPPRDVREPLPPAPVRD
ncbi:MAG: hypothetical protein WKF80_11680 [Thermomicrobiales bacterium]